MRTRTVEEWGRLDQTSWGWNGGDWTRLVGGGMDRNGLNGVEWVSWWHGMVYAEEAAEEVFRVPCSVFSVPLHKSIRVIVCLVLQPQR